MQIARSRGLHTTYAPHTKYPRIYTKYGSIREQTESGWCYEIPRHFSISYEKTPHYNTWKMFT